GSLLARSGHPVLTRAKHPCFAFRDPRSPGHGSLRLLLRASMCSFFEATPVTGRWSFWAGGCGKQRMDALRRRVSHGWLTEPKSNPRAGTTPAGGRDPTHSNLTRLPLESEKNQKKRPAMRGVRLYRYPCAQRLAVG